MAVIEGSHQRENLEKESINTHSTIKFSINNTSFVREKQRNLDLLH